MSSSELEDLVERFVSGRLPRSEWTHLAHLRVGAWHVHHEGADRALASLRERIRRLNDHHGTPNSATSGYHETITVAYVRLIDELLASRPADEPLAERVDAVTSSALAEQKLLLTFWSGELLFSEQARARYVAPDLAPLRFPKSARMHPPR